MTPYELLVELAVRESELVAAERWDDVVELGRTRADLVATLPDQPPAEAAAALEQARRTVLATTGAISVAVAETRAQLRRFQDAHRAMESYTRTAYPLPA